jgi:hypothetical protein
LHNQSGLRWTIWFVTTNANTKRCGSWASLWMPGLACDVVTRYPARSEV